MDKVVETILYVLNLAWNYLSSIRITDFIDIAIMTYVVYKVLVFVRDSKAQQLLKGIALIVLVLQLSIWFHLDTVNFVLKNTLQVGILALFIVFQPELRRALERVGRTKFKSLSFLTQEDAEVEISKMKAVITAVSNAAADLSRDKIGALIVFEREDNCFEYAKNGTFINSDVTPSLLLNIFYPKSPLHDGALVITGNKIKAAACVLPISDNAQISKDLGTRHRAAIGMSEVSDALVLVVSEETGKISLAFEGNMQRDLSRDALELALIKKLLINNENVVDAKNIKNSLKDVWNKKVRRK